MARFFITPADIAGDAVHITGEDAKHIARVLRMREGDTFTACDGSLGEYLCEITKMDKLSVQAKILEKKESEAEPAVSVTLYQGVPKGAKLDYIVQKCVEIGVCRIVPVRSARTVREGEVKKERLSRIAMEAAKQSGRGIIPIVEEAVPFSDALERASEADLAIFPYECERETTLKAALAGKKPVTVSVMIGPEGGFEPEEVEAARKKGFLIVSLGKRILRTETAGPVTCGNIFYEFEA